MISKELVELQRLALVEEASKFSIDRWAKELVIKLIEITHHQWLYRYVMVHNQMAGEVVTRQMEVIRQALEK